MSLKTYFWQHQTDTFWQISFKLDVCFSFGGHTHFSWLMQCQRAGSWNLNEAKLTTMEGWLTRHSSFYISFSFLWTFFLVIMWIYVKWLLYLCKFIEFFVRDLPNVHYKYSYLYFLLLLGFNCSFPVLEFVWIHISLCEVLGWLQ